MAQSGFEILKGADMPGGDYLSIEGGSLKQCTAKCAGDPACQAFTYNIAKRVCFLKDSVGKAKRFKGATSGRRAGAVALGDAPAPAEGSATFEVFEGADMPGGDFDVLRGTTLDQCQQICAGMPQCQAFTQNMAKNVCFLKSGAGEPQRFAGAVSGRRVAGGSAVASAKAKRSQGFAVYEQTDLTGEFSSSTNDRVVGLENCKLQCLFDDECDAFTFDQTKKLCTSKKNYSGGQMSPVQAGDVTSGVKGSAAEVAAARKRYYDSGPTVPEADLAWRKDDTAATFVARIRAAAKPMGGSCEAERAQMQEIAASVRAEFLAASVTAGNSVTVKWTAKPQEKAPPIWLMISSDAPVRFKAPGFYALTPQAIGPFGLTADADRTRAMTTLFGKGTLDQSDVDIVALRAGALNLSVRAVGFLRACEEEFSQEVVATTVTVSRSPVPTFQVRDPFSFEVPKKVWLSPDGTTRLEVFEGRFRLVEISSGAFIVDREGRDAYYSPTGRFVSFLVGGGDDFLLGDYNYGVVDAVDGAMVLQPSGMLGWENNDSFLVVGGYGYGSISASSLLVGDSGAGGEVGCRVCSGRDESYVLDLENDLVHDGASRYATRLSGTGEGPFVYGSDKQATIRFVAEQTGVAPIFFPERWNFRGGLKFVPFEQWIDTANGGKATDSQIEEMENMFYAEPLGIDAGAQIAGLQPVGIGQWRGAVRLERPKTGSDALGVRLSELGIRISDDRTPVFVAGKPEDMTREKGMSFMQPAIAARIAATVPTVKGVFVDTRDTHNCNPDKEAPNGLEALFSIFDRAMEFRIGDRSIWLTIRFCGETSSTAGYVRNFHFFDSSYEKGFLRIDDGQIGKSTPGMAEEVAYLNFDARLYADRYLLIWSTESRGIMLFDIDTRKTIYTESNLGRGELLKEAFYSVEDQYITQVNTDGSFYVYDVSENKRVLEGRYVDDETIAWTPDLRFDASPEGANYVSLRFPGQPGQYSFQQFAKAVKRPGLVSEVLDRRYQPAELALNLPPTLTGEIAAEAGRVAGQVQVAGAVEVRVYQDGLLSNTIPVQQGEQNVAVDVAHVVGARWISLVAVDAEGLASLPVGRDVAGKDHTPPTVHALAVGVDRYATLPALTYAAKDAATLTEALGKQDGQSLRRGNVQTLTDEKATQDAIMSAAEDLVENSKVGETIVFSFAGHGVTDSVGKFYLATSATRAEDVAGSALSWDRLADVLAQSRSRVIVFLDACHSGTAGTSLFATNDDAASDMLARVPAGLLVFSASKGRQFSEESPGAGGGLFTTAVADVISGKRADFDLDGNGAIEISELYAGVKQRVSALSQGRQVPWLARNELVGDFAIF